MTFNCLRIGDLGSALAFSLQVSVTHVTGTLGFGFSVPDISGACRNCRVTCVPGPVALNLPHKSQYRCGVLGLSGYRSGRPPLPVCPGLAAPSECAGAAGMCRGRAGIARRPLSPARRPMGDVYGPGMAGPDPWQLECPGISRRPAAQCAPHGMQGL